MKSASIFTFSKSNQKVNIRSGIRKIVISPWDKAFSPDCEVKIEITADSSTI